MFEFGPTVSRIAAVVALALPAIFWGVFAVSFITKNPPPPGFPWLPPELVGVLLVILPVGALLLGWLARTGQVVLSRGMAVTSLLGGALFLGLAMTAMLMGG